MIHRLVSTLCGMLSDYDETNDSDVCCLAWSGPEAKTYAIPTLLGTHPGDGQAKITSPRSSSSIFSRLYTQSLSLGLFMSASHPTKSTMSLCLRVTNIHDQMDPMEQDIVRVVRRVLVDSDADSARVAADAIDRLIRMKCIGKRGDGNAEDLETFLWELWDIVIQGAREIPHDHPLQDKLVELVSALTEIPPVTVELWQSKTCLWTDLPLLGPSMREAWISPTHNNSRPASEEVVEWINLNAFAARLLNLDAISWTEFAVWELRAALEEPCEGQALECNVVVATVWIKNAGHILYALAVNTGEDTDFLEAANGLFYEGRSILCLERWEFWKRRFGELSEHLEGNAYQVAFEARKGMEAIERSHKG